MDLRCELHLHSCLSPCGSDDMTPGNIVNMALLLELGVIAVTDHNSAGNCRAVSEAAAGTGLIVVPGLELCTSEEIHAVCLFPDLEGAERFGAMVRQSLPPVRNRSDRFGRQLLMDGDDRVIGEEELLLTTASAIGIDQLPALIEEYGGVCWPAHIDRPSYSVLSVLGDITGDMGFRVAGLSRYADEEALLGQYPALGGMLRIRECDAHDLEMMVTEFEQTITAARSSARAVVEALQGEFSPQS